MRFGFTTGTCAAVAAKGAAILLTTGTAPQAVEIGLPDGERVCLPLLSADLDGGSASASVRKDAGDDPDITDGVTVNASVSWHDHPDILICAGEGVGTVTKPGLSMAPGEAAINPMPRRMIETSIREVTDRGVTVVVSILGGRELAARTFNPRLGIEGGLSILGTSGRVRPFSCPALQTSLKCLLDVAVAGGIRCPVFVPGHIGARAAKRHFPLSEDRIIEIGNEWGFMIDQAVENKLEALLIVGHPGKLAKLPMGFWQTHSSRSPGAVPFVTGLATAIGVVTPHESPTVEGLFSVLGEGERRGLGRLLAKRIGETVRGRMDLKIPVAVVLVNMKGDIIACHGDVSPWR